MSKRLAGVPLKCPKCGHAELQVQVVAWWTCKDGEPQTQGDDYIEIAPFPYAICEDCAHQWAC